MDGKVELYFVNDTGDAQYACVPWWSTAAAIRAYEREGYRHVEYRQFLKAVAAVTRPSAVEIEEVMDVYGR